MPRAEPNARVKKLEEAQARLNAELQRARGRLAQEQRKKETRRKILVGSAYLEAADKDPKLMAELRKGLDEFLKNDRDRELFELPPRSKGSTSK